MNADIEGEGRDSWRFVPWSNCAICGKNCVLLDLKKAQASKEASCPELSPWKADIILPICVHQRNLRLKSLAQLLREIS